VALGLGAVAPLPAADESSSEGVALSAVDRRGVEASSEEPTATLGGEVSPPVAFTTRTPPAAQQASVTPAHRTRPLRRARARFLMSS
jgi:hypothetical protein